MVIGLTLLSGCGENPSGKASDVTKSSFPCINNNSYHGIVGGTRVYSGDESEKKVVMILARSTNDSMKVCTGSLIDSKHILTAAHCVDGFTADQVHVVFNNDIVCGSGFDPVKDVEGAVKIKVHDKYDSSKNAENDIALIEIKANKRADYPVQKLINEDSVLSNDTLTSLGYGKTDEALSDSGYLRTVSKSFVQEVYIDKEKSLLYTAQQDKGVCQGDSGGPLIGQVGGEDRIMAILSAVSGKDKETVCHSIAIYMYVPQYLPWIQKSIAE